MSNIHNKELKKNTSLLSKSSFYLPIFQATKTKNETINEEYDMFGYNLKLSGRRLNNDKDFKTFLYIIQNNKLNLTIDLKDILYDLGICDQFVRPNAQRKQAIKDALDRLMEMKITISNDKYELSFRIIDSLLFDKDSDKVSIRISEDIKTLYEKDGFTRVIDLKKLEDLSQYEISLYRFICAYSKKIVYIKLDKLHNVLAPNKNVKEYNRQLKRALESLKEKGKIGTFYTIDKKILYVNKRVLDTKERNKIKKSNLELLEKILNDCNTEQEIEDFMNSDGFEDNFYIEDVYEEDKKKRDTEYNKFEEDNKKAQEEYKKTLG